MNNEGTRYALVKAGVVDNVVIWDGNEGEGDVPLSELAWPGCEVVALGDDEPAHVGEPLGARP